MTLRFGTDLLLYDEEGSQTLRGIPEGKSYVYILLVEAGQISYRIDDADYVVHEGDMMVIIHNKGAECLSCSDDYRARVALLSRSYLEYLHVPNAYRMFLTLRRNPVMHLDQESWGIMRNSFSLISSTLRHEDNSYRRFTIYYALKTYLFTLAYLAAPEQQREPGREEQICTQFLDLLEEHYRQEHSVSFYAEQLHLVPKYLSACVKGATGKPAIDRIGERLLMQAQKMLLQPDRSISEICYYLGFPNLSAFGKFFRSHTGIGPREWRNANKNA